MLTVEGQLVGRADDKRAKEPIAERDLERRQIRRQESRLRPFACRAPEQSGWWFLNAAETTPSSGKWNCDKWMARPHYTLSP